MGVAEDSERQFLTEILGNPNGELSNGDSPADRITVLHFITDDEEDPSVFFVTVGAATPEPLAGAERYELVLQASGTYSAPELDHISRALLTSVRRFATDSVVVVPERIVAIDELASVFPGRSQALVTDYMYFVADYVPLGEGGARARLLSLNPIFDEEVRWVRTMSQGQAIQAFTRSGVRLRDVERDALLVQVGPHILPAEREASPMASSQRTRTVRSLYESLEPWLEEHSPSAYSDLQAPLSPDDLKALESALGRTLPDDLREALQIHDGRPSLNYYRLMPAERIQERYEKKMKDVDKPSSFPGNGTCRKVVWSKAWIPFAEDGGLNFLCVDLDPGPKGTAGQVIRWDRNAQGAQAAENWKCFSDWFGTIVDACLAGEVDIDAEGFITLK